MQCQFNIGNYILLNFITTRQNYCDSLKKLLCLKEILNQPSCTLKSRYVSFGAAATEAEVDVLTGKFYFIVSVLD